MRISTRRATFAALLTTTALIATPVLAQSAAAEDETDSTEIVVTAQKRSESLQNVPISIQAIGTQKLDQLNISNFSGYAQQLPSVTFQGSGTPGVNVIYMRGVASGGETKFPTFRGLRTPAIWWSLVKTSLAYGFSIFGWLGLAWPTEYGGQGAGILGLDQGPAQRAAAVDEG